MTVISLFYNPLYVKAENGHSVLFCDCFISIVETPAQAAPVAPAAYYLGPSHDGSRPGVMYVNTYKHETRWAVNCHNLLIRFLNAPEWIDH